MSSFQRSPVTGASTHPKGCRPSSKVMCTPTGLSSFDELLLMPHGIPLESNLLIKEDVTEFITNSSSISINIMRAFLATAFQLEQDVFFIDGCQTEEDCKKSGPLSALPSPKHSVEPTDLVKESESEKMTEMQIAWRYSNLKINQTSPTATHSLDFGRRVKFSKTGLVKYCSILDGSNDRLPVILEDLKKCIDDSQSKGTILRLVIRGLGSPFWSSLKDQAVFIDSAIQLCRQRKTPVLASIIGNSRTMESLFDSQWDIQSIRKEDRTLKDYSAFLNLTKPLRIPRTLQLIIPESTSLAIKFERKRFLSLHIFHMPPSIDVVEDTLEF